MKLEECFERKLLRKQKFPDEVPSKEIANAKHHLENAKQCIANRMYDLAVVSIYTAMFHAARALLFRDGIKERSHVCVSIYIREKYPHLKELAATMEGYRRGRHTMLYGIDVEVAEDDSQYGVEAAGELILLIETELGAS